MSRFALLLALAAGAGVSIQAFLNGRLAASLGSVVLAGSVNNIVCFLLLAFVAAATGAGQRALARATAAPALKPWHVLAGVNGAFFVGVTTAAAPRVGIALLTIALVLGQTAGSLVADAVGLGPGGPRPLTVARVVAVGLALLAAGLGTVGSEGAPQLGILALAVVAGAGVPVQQAAIGHVVRATGEPLAAGAINFGVGGILLVCLALVLTGGSPPGEWSAPAEVWLGGLVGAGVGVVIALVVGTLGLVQLMLALVAGQSIAGLVLDLAAPAPGNAVTMLTLLSVFLTLTAVLVSSAGSKN